MLPTQQCLLLMSLAVSAKLMTVSAKLMTVSAKLMSNKHCWVGNVYIYIYIKEQTGKLVA